MNTSVLDRFRQPEYTGENRCIPCTATNVLIALALSVAVGYGWAATVGRFAWPIALAVFGVGIAAVWLRGYLVPGTPELTKRYFPDWLLRRFDKHPTPGATPGGLDAGVEAPGVRAGSQRPDERRDHSNGIDAGEGNPGSAAADGTAAADGASSADGTSAADGTATADTPPAADTDATETAPMEPETVLLSAGVVEPCEDEDDLCLVDGFRVTWRERMGTIRDASAERDELARELDLDPADVTIEDHGDAFVARNDGQRLGQWESRAALVADLSAARVLPEWVDGWEDLPVRVRSQLLGGLRIFLDTCPVCEGPVTAGMETVESCCRSHDVVAANCEDCDARLLEVTYQEPA